MNAHTPILNPAFAAAQASPRRFGPALLALTLSAGLWGLGAAIVTWFADLRF
jgi:hypothetical protein